MSLYKPYPKYKNSGVEWLGEVPEHWEAKRLKHIADVRLSNVDKHTVEGQKVVRLCNYLDVYNNRRITSKIDFMSATASDEQIERLSLQKYDVIITKDSEDPSDIGIPALIEEDIFGLVCGYHLAILRPTAAIGDYLSYLLQSTFARSAFEVEATGMTRYALGKYAIENLTFALPHQSEQTSIASFLDRETSQIDALISEKERLISLLQEYRQALISHAVTKGLDPKVKMKDSGVEWLGEVPNHWSLEKIKHFTKFMGGGTPSRQKIEYWQGEIPWVSPKDMKSEQIGASEEFITLAGIENSSSCLFEAGKVLMVVRSGILKHTIPIAINTVSVAVNQDMKVLMFATDKCNNWFFLRWVQGLNDLLILDWTKQGATVDSIEQEYIANTIIPLPPVSEQLSIISFLKQETSRIDALISESRRFIDLLTEYRSSLITETITGKIDIRGYHV